MLKALKFIDRKRKDGLDKKQILVFLNSNVADSQLKMSDITTIYRRLSLKQTGIINYIDFFNLVYGRQVEKQTSDSGPVAVKNQKLKKKFITMLDQQQKDIKVQKNAQYHMSEILTKIESRYSRS